MSSIKNNFDAVRLFAATLVLYSHQFALQGLPEPLVLQGLSFGSFGVFIFFSVSGFLVAQSWRRSPQVLSFAKKRLLRIWPGFAVFTLFQLLLVGPVLTTLNLTEYLHAPETLRYLKNLYFDIQYALPGLYPQNVLPLVTNGSAWTLPWELKCYLLLVVVSLLWSKLQTHWRVMVLTLALLALFVIGTKTPYQASAVKWQFVLCFFLGVLLDIGRHQLALSFKLQSMALVFVALLLFLFDQSVAAVVLLSVVLTIVIGVASTPVVQSAGRFGDLSYGVYLYGFFVQQLFFHAGGAQLGLIAGFVVVAVITYLFAFCSWHGVEKHALKFK